VFVDESFERFLKMTEVDSKYGYFAYGGVGVPAGDYDALKSDFEPIFQDYLKLVPGGESNSSTHSSSVFPTLIGATLPSGWLRHSGSAAPSSAGSISHRGRS